MNRTAYARNPDFTVLEADAILDALRAAEGGGRTFVVKDRTVLNRAIAKLAAARSSSPARRKRKPGTWTEADVAARMPKE